VDTDAYFLELVAYQEIVQNYSLLKTQIIYLQGKKRIFLFAVLGLDISKILGKLISIRQAETSFQVYIFVEKGQPPNNLDKIVNKIKIAPLKLLG